jgi:hypothetical protein
VTCEASLRGWWRIVAGLLAPVVPLAYVVGQTIGWFSVWFPELVTSSEITLLNEHGENL